jgi:Zn-dependent peptidase ImmA (M78 family)
LHNANPTKGEEMKLPKKVRILGRTFTVEYFDFDKKVQANDLNGSVDHHKQNIQINNTIHRESQEATLLHEIIHIVSRELKIGLDEDATCKLHTGLYQVLNDNGFLKDG